MYIYIHIYVMFSVLGVRTCAWRLWIYLKTTKRKRLFMWAAVCLLLFGLSVDVYVRVLHCSVYCDCMVHLTTAMPFGHYWMRCIHLLFFLVRMKLGVVYAIIPKKTNTSMNSSRTGCLKCMVFFLINRLRFNKMILKTISFRILYRIP